MSLRKKLVFYSLLLPLSVSSFAQKIDQHKSFYGEIGGALLNGSQLNSRPKYLEDGVDAKRPEMRMEFKTGGAFDVSLGYHYRPVSFRGDVGYLVQDSDQLRLNRSGFPFDFRDAAKSDKAVGRFSGLYGTLNLVYPVPVANRYFQPYVAVGAGVLHYDFDTANVNYGANSSASKRSALLYNAEVGIHYQVTAASPFHWGVRYRYLMTSSVELELYSKEQGVVKKLVANEDLALEHFGIVLGYQLDTRV